MIEPAESFRPMAAPQEPLRGVDDGLADIVSQAHNDLDYIRGVNLTNLEVATAERAQALELNDNQRLTRRAENAVARQQAEQAYRIAISAAEEADEDANQTAEEQRQLIEANFQAQQQQTWTNEQAITDTHGSFRRMERDYVEVTALQRAKTLELSDAEVGLATLHAKQAADEITIEKTGKELARIEPLLEAKVAAVRKERVNFNQLGEARVALSNLTMTAGSVTAAGHQQHDETMQEAEALVESSAVAALVLEREVGRLDGESRRLSGLLTKVTIDKQKRVGAINNQEVLVGQLQTEIANCHDELERLAAEILATKQALEHIEIEPAVIDEVDISTAHDEPSSSAHAAEQLAPEAAAQPAYTVVPSSTSPQSTRLGHGPGVWSRLIGHPVLVPGEHEPSEMERAG